VSGTGFDREGIVSLEKDVLKGEIDILVLIDL
jgi:hypothetical protein